MSTILRRALCAAIPLIASLPAHADDDQRAASIETIIVTASPLSNDPDKIASIVGQVGRDQILRNGGATIADALSNVAGVTGTSFAGGASRPVIRGFDSNRVRLLEDGIGTFDVSEVGPDHGVPVDPLAAQSIEVVRGAATLRYGSQAIGGVVNTINNRVPMELPKQPFTGEAAGTYGTSGNSGEGSVLADARAGDFAFHADAFVRHTGDYDIPGGTQANSFFRGDGFSTGGSYFFGDNRVGAAIVHYDAKYGIPSDSTFIDMKQTKGLFRSAFALPGTVNKLTVEGGYADYRHDEIDPATKDVLATFRNKEWDLRSEAMLAAFGPFSQAAIGVQVQHRSFAAEGDARNYLLPSTNQSEALFAFAEVPLTDAARLQFGGRAEHADVRGIPVGANAPVSRGFTPLSGSASLLVTASEAINLGLTLTSAARAPNLTELFARGAHDGPATFETGDPNLRLERANSIEGTVNATVSGIHVESSLWGTRFSNYIYGRLTGRTCDEEGLCAPDDTGDFRELTYEQRGARFWGAELKASALLWSVHGWQVKAQALGDYVRASLDGAGSVPRIPPYHVGGGLDAESEHWDAGFLLKYAGAQNRIGAGETPTDGFVNLDAHIVWRPWSDRPNTSLTLSAHNLTDSVQRNAVSLNKDVVILPGRGIRLTARAGF